MIILVMFVIMLLFGFIHSLTAGQASKRWLRTRIGERAYQGFYRLGYNLLSVVLMAPAAYLIVLEPGRTVWQVDGGLALIFLALQALGLIGMGISLLQIDLGQFSGLAQMAAYLKGDPLPLPTEPLQVGGVYRLVRHPLYLFSILIIWPVSSMTEALLAFNIGATLYFIVGSRLEEQRLAAAFGEPYREYQQRVPWLIPFVHLPRQIFG